MLTKTSRKRKEALAFALAERQRREERARQCARGGLLHFVRYFWPILEPGRPLIEGWPMWAVCQHLEAVSRGEIRKLLINISPGSMKSLLCNVFWPAWTWSCCNRPEARFLAASYASHLTQRDNGKFLRLLQSSEFRELYGDKFELTECGKVKVANSATGFKLATSVGGVGTGERGDFLLIDDPHNVTEGESETVRQSTITWFREAFSNRMNDMDKSAIVVIMQRVHQEDVSGVILDDDMGYEHLCIPMLYDPSRHCETSIGWSDPRTEAGECFWSARFPPAAVEECRALGEFVWHSQYQQTPETRGGGLLPRDAWRSWDPDNGKFPKCDFVVVSLDPAFTKKDENDPSGLTVWGAFKTPDGHRGAILLHAWRKWLVLHGPEVCEDAGEAYVDFKARTSSTWGLVEWVADACKRFGADRLLIEAKASGHSVAQEMARLHAGEKWSVELIDPKKLDKEARALRIQPDLIGGLMWAPNRDWAQLVIDECSIFPRGKYDDLCDSTTQAIWYLKSNKFIQRHSEVVKSDARALRKSYDRSRQQPLYTV